MEGSGCTFAQYGLYGVFTVVAVLGAIILRIFRGGKLSTGEYIFGAWNLTAFAFHAICDTYFFFNQRILPKTANEPISTDLHGCYVAAIRNMWRDYGAADSRIFQDEYQPHFLTTVYGSATVCLVLTFLTYLGHLTGAKWAHPMQIAAAAVHFGLNFAFVMPEYLVGFLHVKDMRFFIAANLPFTLMPILAFFASMCKIFCATYHGGAQACPFSGAATDKKKQ